MGSPFGIDEDDAGDIPAPVDKSDKKTLVLVVGSLGDLVKKVIETEIRIEENPRDGLAIIEIASLRRLLEEWPVLDEEKASTVFDLTKIAVHQYRTTEKELENIVFKMRSENKEALSSEAVSSDNVFWLCILTAKLFDYRDKIRSHLSEFNRLSGGVGKTIEIPSEGDLVFY